MPAGPRLADQTLCQGGRKAPAQYFSQQSFINPFLSFLCGILGIHYNLPGRDFPDLVAEQVITKMHLCVVSSLFTLLSAALGFATLSVRMDTPTTALPKRLARVAAAFELSTASTNVSSNLLHQDTSFGFAFGPVGPEDLWPLNFSNPVRPSCHGEVEEPLVCLLQTQETPNSQNNTAFKDQLLLPGFECPLLSSAGPTEMRARPPGNYSCLQRSFTNKHEPNTTNLSCEVNHDELNGRPYSTVPLMQQRCCNCASNCNSDSLQFLNKTNLTQLRMQVK